MFSGRGAAQEGSHSAQDPGHPSTTSPCMIPLQNCSLFLWQEAGTSAEAPQVRHLWPSSSCVFKLIVTVLCHSKITEYPELVGTHRDHQVQFHTGPPKNLILCLRALSKHFSNSRRLHEDPMGNISVLFSALYPAVNPGSKANIS